jgi:hypothetical protein
MDPCFYNIKVHEKEKRKGSYLKEMKRNTLCSYLKKMISQGFLPRPNHLAILSDARVFTLKPEYKKENRPDEKDPLGTKESENEGHFFQSPVFFPITCIASTIPEFEYRQTVIHGWTRALCYFMLLLTNP